MKTTFDVRLLDSAQSVVRARGDDGADEFIVRFYGKTRDNKSITILCPDYKPYFHVFSPSESLVEKLRVYEDVVSVRPIKLEYKGSMEDFAEVRVKTPWAVRKIMDEFALNHRTIVLRNPPDDIAEKLHLVPEFAVTDNGDELRLVPTDRVYSQKLVEALDLYRFMDEDEALKFRDKTVFFSADIQPTNRFVYDHDLETCIRVSGEILEGTEYTTDIVLKVSDAKDFGKCPIFTPKLRVLSFDIENSIKHRNIYCLCLKVYDEATGKHTEKMLYSKYGMRPDTLSELEEEMRLEDERQILRDFVTEVRILDPDVITGYNINNYDLQVLYDRANLLFPDPDGKREGAEILKLGRDHVPLGRRENRTTKFVTWDVKGRLVQDAWLGVKKELKPKREGLGYVSQQLFGDTKDNINSTKIDEEWTKRKDEVIKYCLKDADLAMRILLHPKINTLSKLMDVAIPSKLPVKEVSGGQNRMIESLMIRMVDRERVAVPMSGSDAYEYEGGFVYETKPGLWENVIGLDFSSMYPSQIKKHNICFTTYTKNRDEAAHISPVGAMFISKEKRHGIIPRMVEGLLDSRKEAKAAMKKAKADGDVNMADYYDRLQAAIKVLANATYGYFGAKFCRWPFNSAIAPSITAWAREEIQTVVNTLEGRGYTVIAGDTDSVFFTSENHTDLDACKTLGFSVQKEFSEGGMHLELEKVMSRFFAHAKKRYFGRIVWPGESLLVRGYEPRRTDTFDMQSETMTKVFEIVLDGRPQEAVAYSKDTIDRILSGKVELGKFVVSKSVNDFDSYANPESLAHVNAAKRLKELGYEFTPGMKMPYVITDSQKTPMRAEPVIEGVEFTGKPDYKYYAERLATSLARITEAFGCDERMLMLGNSQKNLAAWFGDGEQAAAIKPRQTGKKKVKSDKGFDAYW